MMILSTNSKPILNSANFKTVIFLKISDISFRKIGISKSI